MVTLWIYGSISRAHPYSISGSSSGHDQACRLMTLAYDGRHQGAEWQHPRNKIACLQVEFQVSGLHMLVTKYQN